MEKLKKQIVDLQENEIKLKQDIENYKKLYDDKVEELKNANTTHGETVAQMTNKINELQNINQQYFLQLITQNKQVNNIETEHEKEEKYSGGLDFNDFINKL